MLQPGQAQNAARQLGISRQTVWRYCRAEPSIIKNGVIDLDALEQKIKKAHSAQQRGAPLGEPWERSKRAKRKLRPDRAKKFLADIRKIHRQRQRRRRRTLQLEGVSTLGGVAFQFDLWRRRIGDTWQQYDAEVITGVRQLLAPIIAFDNELNEAVRRKRRSSRVPVRA
jgi:hypothetical protein